MISSLRAFFLSRLLREKILLIVFIGFGTVIWLSAFSKRAVAFWREQRTTTVALKTQQDLLNRRVQIQADVEKAAAQLDPAKTFNRNRLIAEVSNLSSAAGFRANTSGEPGQTTTNGQFSVHNYSYTIRNIPQTEWMALQKFYVALRDRSPYIGIDQATLVTSPTNRTQLSLQLKVSAVEPLQH